MRPGSRGDSQEGALTATRAPRIVIASHLRLLRDGLADSLERRIALQIVALPADVHALRAAVRSHVPDMVLLDAGFDDSLALVREIGANPLVRMIVFAVADENDERLVSCIEAGVAGYIAHDGSLDDVVAAVRSVARGETIVSPRLAASLFRRLAALERERRSGHASETSRAQSTEMLSRREREILALIDQGMANKEIASRLCIEVATVKNHVHRILQKLQVARRGQAVARVRASVAS